MYIQIPGSIATTANTTSKKSVVVRQKGNMTTARAYKASKLESWREVDDEANSGWFSQICVVT